jgi:Type IV pilin-like G and H, putative
MSNAAVGITVGINVGIKIGLVGWACVAMGGCKGPVLTSSTPQASSLASPLNRTVETETLPSPQASALEAPETQAVDQVRKDPPSPEAPSTSILGRIKQDVKSKVVIAKQDSGQTFLSNVLVSQQAEKLVKGRFNPDLKRLSTDTPLENDEYRLEVRQADAAQAIIVAIAKQPGFASYTGIAYALPGEIPATGICKTNIPSQTPPSPPKRIKQGFICSAGASTAR